MPRAKVRFASARFSASLPFFAGVRPNCFMEESSARIASRISAIGSLAISNGIDEFFKGLPVSPAEDEAHGLEQLLGLRVPDQARHVLVRDLLLDERGDPGPLHGVQEPLAEGSRDAIAAPSRRLIPAG
jgi:hypothetical protein